MKISRRVACRVLAGSLCGSYFASRVLAETDAADRFAGFPEIGVHRKPQRTLPVITSDGVAGVLRPKWTRAMTDLGGWQMMFRFRGDIYLTSGRTR